eukprot:PhM_4_TR2082/c0_g1_i1/m.91960
MDEMVAERESVEEELTFLRNATMVVGGSKKGGLKSNGRGGSRSRAGSNSSPNTADIEKAVAVAREHIRGLRSHICSLETSLMMKEDGCCLGDDVVVKPFCRLTFTSGVNRVNLEPAFSSNVRFTMSDEQQQLDKKQSKSDVISEVKQQNKSEKARRRRTTASAVKVLPSNLMAARKSTVGVGSTASSSSSLKPSASVVLSSSSSPRPSLSCVPRSTPFFRTIPKPLSSSIATQTKIVEHVNRGTQCRRRVEQDDFDPTSEREYKIPIAWPVLKRLQAPDGLASITPDDIKEGVLILHRSLTRLLPRVLAITPLSRIDLKDITDKWHHNVRHSHRSITEFNIPMLLASDNDAVHRIASFYETQDAVLRQRMMLQRKKMLENCVFTATAVQTDPVAFAFSSENYIHDDGFGATEPMQCEMNMTPTQTPAPPPSKKLQNQEQPRQDRVYMPFIRTGLSAIPTPRAPPSTAPAQQQTNQRPHTVITTPQDRWNHRRRAEQQIHNEQRFQHPPPAIGVTVAKSPTARNVLPHL